MRLTTKPNTKYIYKMNPENTLVEYYLTPEMVWILYMFALSSQPCSSIHGITYSPWSTCSTWSTWSTWVPGEMFSGHPGDIFYSSMVFSFYFLYYNIMKGKRIIITKHWEQEILKTEKIEILKPSWEAYGPRTFISKKALTLRARNNI